MWLTISEVAKYLKVSKETIYKLAQTSRLPASKLGNQWRFKQDLIDQWLQTQTPDTSIIVTAVEKKREVRRG